MVYTICDMRYTTQWVVNRGWMDDLHIEKRARVSFYGCFVYLDRDRDSRFEIPDRKSVV